MEKANSSVSQGEIVPTSFYELRKRKVARDEENGGSNFTQKKKRMNKAKGTVGVHPLLIAEIAENLMKYISGMRDLFQCRQVCVVWNREATKQLNLNHYFAIHTQDHADIRSYEKMLVESNAFVNILPIRPTHLHIHVWRKRNVVPTWYGEDSSDSDGEEEDQRLAEFMQQAGKGLTHLRVEVPNTNQRNRRTFPTNDFVHYLRNAIFSNLENITFLDFNIWAELFCQPSAQNQVQYKPFLQLKTLQIYIPVFGRWFKIVEGEIFAKYLFELTPNLETIKLAAAPPFAWVESMALANILDMICEHAVDLRKLKHMHLEFKLPNLCIENLIKAKFPLASLYIANYFEYEINFDVKARKIFQFSTVGVSFGSYQFIRTVHKQIIEKQKFFQRQQEKMTYCEYLEVFKTNAAPVVVQNEENAEV